MIRAGAAAAALAWLIVLAAIALPDRWYPLMGVALAAVVAPALLLLVPAAVRHTRAAARDIRGGQKG